jgi:parallel beta-helix repeat protein
VVQRNHIGTDVTGTAPMANDEGIHVDESPDNLIGGTTAQERNVVSGNHANGILITGGSAQGNAVQGNIIGADIAGTASIPNRTGIFMVAPGNTIGGASGGAGNLVSGNHDFGIHLVFAPGNTIAGNRIGTDAEGAVALGNGFAGIFLEMSPGNVIGGTTPGARNIVSANGFGGDHPFDGITLAGPETHGTVVQGNYIGTDVTGTVALGNANAGVMLEHSHDNTVGGTASGAGNLISGNIEGVTFVEAGNTFVQGNRIGTDVTGTSALGNETGVLLLAHGNVIGGADPAARNLISGNTDDAIRLELGAGGNQIIGNLIGTDVTGTAAVGNGGRGVHLRDAHGNSVGGGAPGEGNVISANWGGVTLALGASGNAVVGNRIGSDVTGIIPLGNTRSGIFVNSDAHANGIGGQPDGMGNTIAFNGGAGIRLLNRPGNAAGPGNAIERNSIFENGGLGIDLGGGGVTENDAGDADAGSNDWQNFPILTAADASGVTGTFNSTPSTDFWIEFFTNDVCDPEGYGEGQTFLGAITVFTDGSGDAVFALEVPVSPGSIVTATATNLAGSTSEFSACFGGT